MRAVTSAHTQNSVRQNAAFDRGLEPVFHEPRQARAGPGFDLSEERLEMFPHQAMQDRLRKRAAIRPLSRYRCSARAARRE